MGAQKTLWLGVKRGGRHHQEPTAVDLWVAEGVNFSLAVELNCADTCADGCFKNIRSLNESPRLQKIKTAVLKINWLTELSAN